MTVDALVLNRGVLWAPTWLRQITVWAVAWKNGLDTGHCYIDDKERGLTMYTPKPVNTAGVELPGDLLELTERIAENVHENWAAGRIAEGWTYGETRDDAKKTTPCLVPYAELSEEEKAYDRTTALQTLQLIVALGYTIQKA